MKQETDNSGGETQVSALLKALEESDVDAFHQYLTDDFAGHITDDAILDVAVQLKDRLQAGHNEVYLGSLREGGRTVHLWGIKFSDGNDDALLRVAFTESKASGCVITPPFQ